METQLAYCPTCGREVHLARTPLPLHGGQANLPDAPELICLDCSPHCAGQTCGITNLAGVVMAKRLVEQDGQ